MKSDAVDLSDFWLVLNYDFRFVDDSQALNRVHMLFVLFR
jgi:hypothetical protein